MRQVFIPFSICISVFLSACSTSQQLAQTSTSNIRTSRQFIEDVTIDNGSNSVRMDQGRQVYKRQASEIADQLSDYKIPGLDQPVKVSNISLTKFIEQWYGVPYRLGGTSKLGIDCSAFVRELYGNVYDLELLRTASQQFSTCKYVSDWRNLKEGDLVFFKIRTKRISHVGVYLGDGNFVHASLSKGVMISNLTDAYWTRYFVGGGQVKESGLAQGRI